MPHKKTSSRRPRTASAAGGESQNPGRTGTTQESGGETNRLVIRHEAAVNRSGARAGKPAGRTRGRNGSPFPIVGIGASAGGLEALVELFANMPLDTGMGFVVVTHQHPGHTSMLPELLSRSTSLPVIEAGDGMKVEPNHVYIAPSGCHLALLHGILHRMESDSPASTSLPIDYFFHSLAGDRKENAVCIVLSGTGSDGTAGLKAIRHESGLTIVQDLNSAKFSGMPDSAAATGMADLILPPAEIPRRLVAAMREHFARAHAEAPEDSMAEPMQKMFILLRARTGHDFSAYKQSTLRRRIERRMNLNQISKAEDYVRFLEENPHEIDTLFKELLISVTSFFRDVEAFEVLEKSVLPNLVASRPDDYTFRIWVPGCASGEEAYSLAILMRETVESSGKRCSIQIFGTDLDSEAISMARNGSFSDDIAAQISPRRLERHFFREDGRWRIRKEVRELVVFAVQNVIKDPPFTRLDLISCRNLLIYLNADLQRRLLPVFHYALKPGGLLFLGPSETIGNASDLFDVIDKKWKIYRRSGAAPVNHPLMEFQSSPARLDTGVRPVAPVRSQGETGLSGVVERLLLTKFSPASVVVNDRGDVMYIHGRTGAYLEPAAGQPRLNVLAMAREGLQLEMASALRQAAAGAALVNREGVQVRTNGAISLIDLSVHRLEEPDSVRGLFLITFAPAAASAAMPATDRKDKESVRVAGLERELQCTRESLQTTIEELETSNEELKSTNEELQSTNEELQSSNEELETSREEMQSLNEELTTVNAELQSKVEDLSRANDDMQNLLNSTEIATVFLDNKLNIKRYTEQARLLIKLIPSDIGRSIGDLVSSLTYDRLLPDCREVLRTLVFRQAEVRTKDGHWYLMRIMPYRTGDNVIDGLVLTFVDINPVKEAEKSLLRMSKVFLDGPEPMIITDLSGRIIDLNREAARVFGWSRQEMLGESCKMTVPVEFASAMESRLQACLSGQAVLNSKVVLISKAGRTWSAALTLLLLADDGGAPESICLLVKQPVS